MKAVVQRVSSASVAIEGKSKAEIGEGLLVLVGINEFDNEKIIDWMCNKLINLRIFEDEEGKMNKSVTDINGSILLISNFTLYGDCNKGFRPSFISAAKPHISEPIYEQLIEKLKETQLNIQTGIFGANMQVELVNSGPVTLIIEK